MDKITILVVDDHPVVRHGLRSFLSLEKDMVVVGEASNGEEAVQVASQLRPDVVLMDLVMPGGGGTEAIEKMSRLQPDTKVLVLSSFIDEAKVLPAIQAGAVGYVIKDVAPSELAKAIRQVITGEPVLDGQVTRKLMEQVARPKKPVRTEKLTGREEQILELVAKGHTNKEIAAELVISEKTVKTHVSNILSKLRLSHRTELALYALRYGEKQSQDS